MIKNPYASSQNIKIGTPITILFKKGLRFNFSLESKKDDNYTIKANPDTQMVDNLKPYSADRSIVKNQIASVKSDLTFDGRVTALITENNNDLDTLRFRGTINRQINNQVQNITVEGLVSSKKVQSDLTVEADFVADLQFNFNSQIIPRNLDKNLQIQNNNENAENTDNQNQANNQVLSEQDKQDLLLDYMKRMLGESE